MRSATRSRLFSSALLGLGRPRSLSSALSCFSRSCVALFASCTHSLNSSAILRSTASPGLVSALPDFLWGFLMWLRMALRNAMAAMRFEVSSMLVSFSVSYCFSRSSSIWSCCSFLVLGSFSCRAVLASSDMTFLSSSSSPSFAFSARSSQERMPSSGVASGSTTAAPKNAWAASPSAAGASSAAAAAQMRTGMAADTNDGHGSEI
mmetsp:Transcript_28535/g.76167  ORF Transcript_28535/g.76167 Transcript_28535/m.76167 type:complete len:206 (-) Transcript_28535:12-629(-)